MLCTQSEGDYFENDQVHSRPVTVYPTSFHPIAHTKNTFHLSSSFFINECFLWRVYGDLFLTKYHWTAEDFERRGHVLLQWTRILAFALRRKTPWL
jgi:hypothetical protein